MRAQVRGEEAGRGGAPPALNPFPSACVRPHRQVGRVWLCALMGPRSKGEEAPASCEGGTYRGRAVTYLLGRRCTALLLWAHSAAPSTPPLPHLIFSFRAPPSFAILTLTLPAPTQRPRPSPSPFAPAPSPRLCLRPNSPFLHSFVRSLTHRSPKGGRDAGDVPGLLHVRPHD